MTQEDKQLLLKDLCARLPYGVKVQVYDNRYAPTTLTAIDIKKQECIFNFNVLVENCLPYLRPMSSMTEEELKEYHKTFFYHERYDNEHKTGQNCSITFETYDWLNANHFDYRNLIEKGLAIEAPEEMYNIKEK